MVNYERCLALTPLFFAEAGRFEPFILPCQASITVSRLSNSLFIVFNSSLIAFFLAFNFSNACSFA